MGVAVSSIDFPPTFVRQDGPRLIWVRHRMSIPSGTVNVSQHMFAGPVDFVGEGGYSQTFLHVSGNNASGADNIRYTVYGAFNEPSTTPTDRVWFLMRGDRASGAGGQNDTLNAITCGGEVIINTPARSYLVRVCSVSAVSSAVNINVLQIKSNG